MNYSFCVLLFIALLAGNYQVVYGQNPVLEWKIDDQFQQITGLTIQLPKTKNDGPLDIALYPVVDTANFDHETLPPMLGRQIAAGNALHYLPRFPFLQNTWYYVIIHPADPGSTLFQPFFIKTPDLKQRIPCQLVEISPTVDTLPSNTLKLYFHFSTPMQYGQVNEHIVLLDETGTAVVVPFLDMGIELWDPSRKRLTLWFDPGRIKRHLLPNRKMGNPLAAHQQYTLLVRKGWKDVYGQPLPKSTTKTCWVTAPDRTSPNPDLWEIKSPQTSNEPLVLSFNEALDFVMLQNLIGITKARKSIDGDILVIPTEQRWSFTPKVPWTEGRYTLHISTDVEDLAGNNLSRLFDRNIQADNSGDSSPASEYTVDFVIKLHQ